MHLDQILNAMVNAILVCPYCWKLIKPNLHLLRELLFYVKRFGRPGDYASETQESFNKHIRSNIIGSNRQNTLKDVALAFAQQAAARHLTAGGLYQVGSIWQSLTIDFCPPQIRMHQLTAKFPPLQLARIGTMLLKQEDGENTFGEIISFKAHDQLHIRKYRLNGQMENHCPVMEPSR
ncbi:hypothetical protein DFJ73DRAFT_770011 [Zopfochytrium polystomum]|nr:hypothetical protein DFJ73DRAFT_770011 [Zopfochytrium polystomum]